MVFLGKFYKFANFPQILLVPFLNTSIHILRFSGEGSVHVLTVIYWSYTLAK